MKRNTKNGFGIHTERQKSIALIFTPELSKEEKRLEELYLKIKTKSEAIESLGKSTKSKSLNVPGIRKSKHKTGGFIAMIKYKNKESKNWKQDYLGTFKTYIEACCARMNAEYRMNRGGMMKARKFMDSMGFSFFNKKRDK